MGEGWGSTGEVIAGQMGVAGSGVKGEKSESVKIRRHWNVEMWLKRDREAEKVGMSTTEWILLQIFKNGQFPSSEITLQHLLTAAG